MPPALPATTLITTDQPLFSRAQQELAHSELAHSEPERSLQGPRAASLRSALPLSFSFSSSTPFSSPRLRSSFFRRRTRKPNSRIGPLISCLRVFLPGRSSGDRYCR